MTRVIFTAIITLALVGLVADLGAKPQPKEVTLDKCKKKKSAVVFPHADHAKKRKVPCKKCHHTKKNESCSKAGCHAGKARKDAKTGKKIPGCAEMSMKKNPFHILCAGCHKEKKQGPRKCKECHK